MSLKLLSLNLSCIAYHNTCYTVYITYLCHIMCEYFWCRTILLCVKSQKVTLTFSFGIFHILKNIENCRIAHLRNYRELQHCKGQKQFVGILLALPKIGILKVNLLTTDAKPKHFIWYNRRTGERQMTTVEAHPRTVLHMPFYNTYKII